VSNTEFEGGCDGRGCGDCIFLVICAQPSHSVHADSGCFLIFFSLWDRQPARFGLFPTTLNEKTPGFPFFCFRSESGFGVSGSSPAQPFCSGILKPNAGEDSPAPCLGVGADFSLKWVLGDAGALVNAIALPMPNAGPSLEKLWVGAHASGGVHKATPRDSLGRLR
jgi:hypothetical protein